MCPRGTGTWKKLPNTSKKCRWCQERNKGMPFWSHLCTRFFSPFFFFPLELFNSCNYLLKSWKQNAFMERYDLLCAPWSFDLNQSNKSKTLQFTLLQGRLIVEGLCQWQWWFSSLVLFLLLLLFFMILTFWTGQGKIICKEYSINMPVRTRVNIQVLLLSKRKQYAKVQFRFPCRVENNEKTHLTWQRWVLPPLWEWLPYGPAAHCSYVPG